MRTICAPPSRPSSTSPHYSGPILPNIAAPVRFGLGKDSHRHGRAGTAPLAARGRRVAFLIEDIPTSGRKAALRGKEKKMTRVLTRTSLLIAPGAWHMPVAL
jgi:hypothetical protein